MPDLLLDAFYLHKKKKIIIYLVVITSCAYIKHQQNYIYQLEACLHVVLYCTLNYTESHQY